MSGHDAAEDPENKDEVGATLSVQWSDDDDKLQKKRSTLQKVLQTLVNKSKFNGNCDVLNVSEDGRADIRIKPAAAVIELHQMSGQPLKGKDGKTVTIISVSLMPPEPERQTLENTSEKIPSSPVSEPHNVDGQLGGQRSDITSFTFDIPMLHYWYVNQAYKREIERIEKESGGKIMAEMKLIFEPHQKDGNPNFAFSEFTNLVQKCSAESRGFTYPLREVNPEGLKDTMEIIQRPENKLWIALSSEDMTVLGPRESQDAIRKSLNAAQKTLIITHTPAGTFTQTSQKTSLNKSLGSEQPSTSHDQCAENEDEVQVLLSVKWSTDVQPQKCKIELQTLLQTWDSSRVKARNKAREYTVLNVLEDGRAVIRIKPPPAVSELQKLSGQTLKGKDGKTVTISSISLTLPELGIQTPDNASMNLPSSVSEPQHDQELPVEQSGFSSSAAVSTREEKTGCVLPVVHFWYVSHILKEDIKRIERRHGVIMNAEVNVNFVGKQKDKGLKEALSDFLDLIQKCLGDFDGSVTPLKSVDTDEFKDALKMIQRPEHKLLVALSSEEMTIYGPKPIPTVISKSLNAAHTSSANTSNPAAKSQVTSLKKFVVDTKVSGICPGKVNVTSSKNITQQHGATGFSVSRKNSSSVYPSEGASSGPVVNIQSGYSTRNTETKEQGQHQYAMGDSFNPAQYEFTNLYPSAGQLQQAYPNPSVNMSTQGQHQYAMGDSFNPAQYKFTNFYPSAGQFPHTYQNPSVNMPTSTAQFSTTPEKFAVPPCKVKDSASLSKSQLDAICYHIAYKYHNSPTNHPASSVSKPQHLKGQLWEQSNTTTSTHNVPIRRGKVDVKAGGHASMKSRLCQNIATSPKNITQHQGATGFSGSKNNSSNSSEGASSGPGANSQSGYSTRKTEDSAEEGATAGDNKDEECPICKDTFINKKQLKCKHEFCEECLEELKKHMGPVCPVCKDVFGVIEGTQPDGKMSVRKSYASLPGFKNCDTIVIDYWFPSGKQTERHPNPGQRYDGTSRTAYLPDNKEGKEVLSLLQKAFDQKLIFTVGTSTTTGMENQVTWNDIHHKTSTNGGPQSFGYPDPDYLRIVRDELKAKGIK